jgi:hypothetical protein
LPIWQKHKTFDGQREEEEEDGQKTDKLGLNELCRRYRRDDGRVEVAETDDSIVLDVSDSEHNLTVREQRSFECGRLKL